MAWIVLGDTSNNYSPIRAKGERRGVVKQRRQMQAGYLEKEILVRPTSPLRSDQAFFLVPEWSL